VYEFSDSAVVESVEEIPRGGLRVGLVGGDDIELLPGVVELYGGIVVPDDLLLVGTTDSGVRGFVTLGTVLDACYILEEPAVDDGTHILFDWGLRLPKARGFDPGPADDGRFESFREGFCINTDGEVVSYGV
jgi:hypothetical protein